MAISQMQKVTLISSREHLEAILSSVQRLRRVQVIDLQLEQDNENDNNALIEHYDDEQAAMLYDDEALQSINNRMQRIKHAIKQIEQYQVKEGLLKRLTTEKRTIAFDNFQDHNAKFAEHEVIINTNQLTTRIKEINELLEKRKVQIEKYRKWRDLDITPNDIQQFQYVKAIIGTVPNVESNQFIQKIKQHPSVGHKVIFLNDFEYGLVLFYQENKKEELEELMLNANFSKMDYPYRTLPVKKIENWQLEIAQLKEEKQQIIDRLKANKDQLEALKVQADFVKTEYDREMAKKKLGVTKHLVAIEGWIEKDELSKLVKQIQLQFSEDVVIRTKDVEETEIDEVPVKLKNNFLFKPFELVTKMYALPKYNEVDPTPFLMPFYFVFFGMMVADLGYGLLTIAVSLLALKFFKFKEETKSTVWFGLFIGIAISIWGLIYGSFFGFTIPIQLINPNEDVMLVLGLSVAFGVVHIFVALAINVYNKIKERNFIEAYSTGLAWMLLLTGIFMLGFGMMDARFASVGEIGKWLAILNAIGIVVASCIKAGGIGGLGWGFYDLYGATGYIGDLVSYTRLMALGLSGGSIGMAFNMLIQFLPGPARFTVGILLFVLLHGLNMFLSMLSAYVHGARLIFVEFFAKFYTGGGKPFEPLTVSEEYVTVSDEMNNN